MSRRLGILLLLAAVGLNAQRVVHRPVLVDERISALAAHLKIVPDDPAAKVQLAGAFLQKMRETADGAYLDRARKLVDSVLLADPQNYDARRRHMEIEMMMHHFKQVINLARELSAEQSRDTVVLGLLGDAYMERGDYDAAAETYQKMTDVRPSLASYNRVAFYRFVTGDAPGAIEAMRLAIRTGSSEPENLAWCLADLGNMLLKTGAVDDAERSYREALAIFPGYHIATAGLGRVELSRRHYEIAIQHLLAAKAVAPFPEYTGALAKLYRKTGKDDLAKKQATLLDASDQLDRAAGEAANRSLALAYADLQYRTSRALELAKAEMLVREDVYSYDALAWALFRDGKIEEAVAVVGNALRQNTPEPSFYAHAAKIYEATGRSEDAGKMRDRLAALNPNLDIQ